MFGESCRRREAVIPGLWARFFGTFCRAITRDVLNGIGCSCALGCSRRLSHD